MVMKKTGNKHLFRTIKKNGVSFFAVAFIAATSIAIFLGFQSTAEAVLNRADDYFVQNALETLEISCANGITQEDIDAIAALEGADAAEGGYSSMVKLEREDEIITLQALSLCDEMNTPAVIEGTLPTAKNEAAIEELLAEEKGIQVGDEITLTQDGSLCEDTFRVTAIINEPVFCCTHICDSRGKSTEGLGAASYYIELSKEAFDASYYENCFSVVHVKNNSLDEYGYYSDQYEEEEAAFKEEVKTLGQERAKLRYLSLEAEAQSEIESAQAEIEDAQLEILNARTEAEENEEKLLQAKNEIESEEENLADAREEIMVQLQAIGITADLDGADAQLESLGESVLPIREAIAQYQEGIRQLETAKEDVKEAEAELEDAKAQIEESEAEIEESRKGLDEAKDAAEEILLKEWIVAGRDEIGDIRGVRTIVDGIYGLSYSMSVIFLLVAIIVCYAAITRMIDEQRTLVGAQKALGFRPGEILKHYMLYNTLCAFLGVAIGYLASVVIVELLVLHIYKPEFLLGSIPLAFAWKQALLAAGICLAVFLTATYAACSKLVRQPATTLLRGEVPVQGKRMFFENWKWYKKLNLYSRTMIKNVLNDKGRMMTTIMGVVGCISLLLICFSLKLAIADSSVWQFDKYFLYDHRLVFDSSSGSAEEFETALEEEGVDYLCIQDKLKNFRVDGSSWENGRIAAIADTESLNDFMVLENVDTKEVVSVSEDGVLVSRRCAEIYDLSEGSIVEFMDEGGKIREFTVSGVIEHYLSYHLFVTSVSYYEETMGEAADESVFLLKGDSEKIQAVYEKVRNMDGFLSLKDNSEFAANSDVIDPVIGICLLLSAVMALLVLLNQVVMHINRKARELAVMRINGYTLKETRAYIYKDNVVLTVLGLLLGCVFGVGLSYAVIRAVETGAIHYVRVPNLLACACACGVGAFFALIVNLIALRRISRLNLTNVSGN